ncbi:hypothetical protein ACE2AJ_11965 [Aquihabitans daechungensis]|uniref:hypothetical protein n=1 Tax=Aquihabitans daechungensis TaxID=1052257 RepID=UPI003BA39334
MPAPRALLATGVAVGALAMGGAISASARSDDPGPRYGTAGVGEDLTPAQQQAIAAIQRDAPIPVQDARGAPRGFVRDSALIARDERVAAIILERFREAKGPDDEEYLLLFEALRVLDPVPVVDADGTTVGYWTQQFEEIDEIEELTPEARATVDRLLR